MARPGWRTRSALWRYGFAAVTVAIAAMLMLTWRYLFGDRAIAPLLAAILLTGWYAGRGPVVLTAVLAGVVYLLPIPAPLLESRQALAARLVWVLGFASLAAWFGTVRRTAAERLERARNHLEEQVEARTAELRHSEAYLLATQRLCHTGGLGWGKRGALGDIYMSEESFRIFGLDPQTTRPSRELIRQLWHPDDRDRADHTLDAAIQERRPFDMHARIVRPDGSIRYLRILGEPVVDASGDLGEGLAAVADVTLQEEAANKLRQTQQQATEARFAAMLDERIRIARELHDTLLQGFTGVGLQLVAVTNRVAGPPEIVAALHDVVALTQRTLEGARRAIWDIRPASSAGGDFVGTLRAAAEEAVRGTDVRLDFVVEGSVLPTGPDVEAAVLRVMQEAITNVVKHAAAPTVRVVLMYEPTRIRLTVTDHGRGFVVDPEFRAYGGHLGLLGMQERASQVRGTLTVRSSPGQGTDIVLLVACAHGGQAPPPSPNGELPSPA